MTLTIELPNDFIEHYETDKFQDSLMRINSDIRTEGGLCGQYEYELVDALIKAFKGSNAGTCRQSRSSKP